VVEFGAGPLPPAGVRRHSRAVLALARALAPPRELARPIPFGAERRADMADYAQRHYGFHDHRLRDPKVVVQHYTVTDSFQPVFDYFSRNEPDPEHHELPGICAHYVIDRDGTIHRLVPTSLMCRHTMGLNWTSIGIEHVGRSDAQVMGNPRQLAASLRLTRALQGRHGIRTRNVIGHNESRESPFHRERVARMRAQTHGDFPRAVMDGYRRRLEALPAPASMR
jgi:beta-N-acetylhexosaminidase